MGLVNKGDEQRRFGDDLLISSRKADWDRANTEYFKNAEEQYQKAGEDSKAVRDALTARDQALAELPVYARWLSRRDYVAEPDVETFEKLWANAHRLAGVLDPSAAGKPAPQWRGEMEGLTRSVRQGLDEQRNQYRQACAKNETLTEPLPRNWREIEEVLSVPTLAALANGASRTAVRMTLLTNSRKISESLNTKTRQAGRTLPLPLSTAPPRDQAKRQGRLALAMLGETWVNRLASEHLKSVQEFDKLRGLIAGADSGWEISLDGAGEQVGDCWQQLPVRLQEHVQNSRDKPEQAPLELYQADRLARQVDAAGAARIPGNPADEYRRLRLQGLLLWLAERTIHDHWWSEKEGEDPFYVLAGQAFVKDAKEAALGEAAGELTREQRDKRTETERARRLKTDLEVQRLDVPKPLDVYWTSESNIELKYALKAPAAFQKGLPGFPVARINLDPRLKLESTSKEGRTPVEAFAGGKPGEAPLDYRVALISEGAAPLKAELEVLYRGQRINVKTPIHIYRTPDTIVHEYPPVPETGAIAVRVDENAYQGSLAIVLDCSGSMGVEGDYDARTPCKYHDATSALRAILALIPNHTRVSVLVFGHKCEEADRAKEAVIEVMADQEDWDRDDTKQLPRLMNRLEKLRPWWDSPIVDAMVRAQKNQLKGAAGFKTLMVLTDGDDTIYRNSQARARKLIEETFDGKGTVVNIVLFDVHKEKETKAEEKKRLEEKDNAEKQLGIVRELTPPGTKEEAQTSVELARKLVDAMRPKVRVLRPTGALVEGVPKAGHPTTFVGEAGLTWLAGLEPLEYTAVLSDGTKKNFVLERGERLLVTLSAKNNEITFERTVYADYETKRRKSALPGTPPPADQWQLAVMQNERKIQTTRDPFLQMMVSVEDVRHRTAPEGGSLRLYKPRFTWLEVSTQESDKPLRLNWGNLSGYPATAWTVEAPDWSLVPAKPEPKPVLRAWVLSDQEPLSAASPKRDPRLKLESDFLQPIRVGKQEIEIESVRFEPGREVEIKLEKKAKENCLLVRLRYPANQPVMVHLRGLTSEPRGAEHYYYTEASKYTAAFWGVERDQMDSPSFFLDVISIDDVKKTGTLVEVKLPAPDQGQRPGGP
jgi:hypothetical protein